MIKCYIAIGNLTAASRSLEDLKSRDSANSSSYASENTTINRLREMEASAERDMNKSDYRKVRGIVVIKNMADWLCAQINFVTLIIQLI